MLGLVGLGVLLGAVAALTAAYATREAGQGAAFLAALLLAVTAFLADRSGP